MSQEFALATLSASLVLLHEHNKNKEPKRWMYQLFAGGHRHGLDLLDTLKLEDGSGFRNFIRMTVTDFEYLLKMIGGKILKEDTRFSIIHMVKTRSLLMHWLLRCSRTRPHLKCRAASCQ
jgi:hypothetical protein